MATAAHTTQAQTTGYYCGPAATRVALSARGPAPSQTALAAELGTTVNGTDSSVDVARVLNAHLGPGTYGVRFIPGQSATPAQVVTLAADLTFAVDAGYALVANVAGTVHALDGRTYSYPGGHYVAVVGYNGDAAQVADVAVGRDYWVSTAVLADWIATRGYVDLMTPPAALIPQPREDDNMVKLIAPQSGWGKGGVFKLYPTSLGMALEGLSDGNELGNAVKLYGQEVSVSNALAYGRPIEDIRAEWKAMGGGHGGGSQGPLTVSLTGTATPA